MSEFKVVCAWCQKHMRGPEISSDVSHGICPPCLQERFEELNKQIASCRTSLVQERLSQWEIGGES
jgi:hypothetical protein